MLKSVCKKSVTSLSSFLKYYKNSKLVIFGNFGMPGHTHIYNDSINLKEPLIFINFILHVSLEIFAKILQTGCFGYFGHPWLYTPKVILSYYGKHLHLSADKRSTSCLSGDFAWIMETSYFGYFGHASLKKPKIIVSNCRRLQCLSAC